MTAPLIRDPDAADDATMVAVCDLEPHRIHNPFAAQRVWRATVRSGVDDSHGAGDDARKLPVVTDRAPLHDDRPPHPSGPIALPD